MAIDTDELTRDRFAGVSQHGRAAMWEVLCRTVLQRYVTPSDTVVDLGAGSCDFINHIVGEHKVAIDTNPAMRGHAASEVNVVIGDVQAVLARVGDGTVNAVFGGSFFPALADKDTVVRVLQHVRRVLVPGGRLIVLQPNIRYAYREYWDAFELRIPFSHHSFSEALRGAGFVLEDVVPRFLPLHSRVLETGWLLRLYLGFRPAQWLCGRQMLIVARRPALTPVESQP